MSGKSFADFGIEIPAGVQHGEISLRCPECSDGRKKSWLKPLSVNLDKKVWYCHHCRWAGGLGELSDKERAAIPKKFHPTIHFVSSEITNKHVLGWFRGRGISEATLAEFDITAQLEYMGDESGKKELAACFPFYKDGRVVNIKYRTSDKKFKQVKGGEQVFFNYDMALAASSAERKWLIITEGEMDALAVYEAGFASVVSVPSGAPAPKEEKEGEQKSTKKDPYTSKFDFLVSCKPLIDAYQTFIIAVDNDPPGLLLGEELGRRLGYEKCKRVSWPEGCKDANDVLIKLGAEVLHECIESASDYPIKGTLTVADLFKATLELLDKPEAPGWSIGWGDETIPAFNVEPGQMTIVTGVPSHGKSTFIDVVRINLFKQYGVRSAAISPESWPVERHLATLTEMYAGEHYYSMRREDAEYYLGQIFNGVYFIQPEGDDDMMTVKDVLAKAKGLIFRHGIQILVIDPWNEILHDLGNKREDLYISEQLAYIRRFARVNKIHIFVVAHPSKLEKNKDNPNRNPCPTAYDIAGGAMWYNKADNILVVYRPSLETSETEVAVQKIRFKRNGRAGSVMMFTFNPSISQYQLQRVLVPGQVTK